MSLRVILFFILGICSFRGFAHSNYLVKSLYINGVSSELISLGMYPYDLNNSGRVLFNQIDQIYESHEYPGLMVLLKLDLNYAKESIQLSSNEYICSFRVYNDRLAALYFNFSENKKLKDKDKKNNFEKICQKLNMVNKVSHLDAKTPFHLLTPLFFQKLYARECCMVSEMNTQRNLTDVEKGLASSVFQGFSTCLIDSINKVKSAKWPVISVNNLKEAAASAWRSLYEQAQALKSLVKSFQIEIKDIMSVIHDMGVENFMPILCHVVQSKLFSAHLALGAAALPLKFVDFTLELVKKLKGSISFFERVSQLNLPQSVKKLLFRQGILQCGN